MAQIVWEEIAIEFTFTAQSFGGPFDHIELKCKEQLPVTETGYRSHFIHPKELALFESPEAFVREWLDEAAKSSEWKLYKANSRQGELF